MSRQVRALLPDLATPIFARRLSWCMLLALECLADHERSSAVDVPVGELAEGRPSVVEVVETRTARVVTELVTAQAALLRAPA